MESRKRDIMIATRLRMIKDNFVWFLEEIIGTKERKKGEALVHMADEMFADMKDEMCDRFN